MALILIAAGGTGGHVYPALAAAEALHKSAPSKPDAAHDLVFVGSRDGMEQAMVAQAGVAFRSVHSLWAGPLNGVGVWRALASAFKLSLGALQALGLLARLRPQAILCTGGWANVPLALAAWLLRVPVVVYLPDIEPALTIRFIARFARYVAITVPESAAYFKAGQTVVTGYPLRAKVLAADSDVAHAHFGLDPDRDCLLCFGGSRGARSINLALEGILGDLLAAGVQVLHITGELDYERSRQATQAYADHPDYRAFAYLHDDMGMALAAADVVVCRAGASVLGELPHFGLPSILVPYPHAWQYQRVNADYLAERGAALRMDDEQMGEALLPRLRELLGDAALRAKMHVAAHRLASDGAHNLAELVLRVATGGGR